MDPILAQRSWFLSSAYGFCLKPYRDSRNFKVEDGAWYWSFSKWGMPQVLAIRVENGWKWMKMVVYHILSPCCGSPVVKASKSSKLSSGWIWKPQRVRGTRHSLSFCQCLGDPESLWGARSCARDVPGWGSDQFCGFCGSWHLMAYHSVAHWIFTHTQVDPWPLTAGSPFETWSWLIMTWYILVSHGRQCFNHWCEFLRDLRQCSGGCLLALQTCSLSACALKHLPVLDLDGTCWLSWGKLIYTVGSKPVQ